MRVVEFLIYLLEAHAQTLQRLAALFGEEALLAMLEVAGEQDEGESKKDEGVPPRSQPLAQNPRWLDSETSALAPGESNAYAELEDAVRHASLPAFLEFHLWAYPLYRAYIESPLDLEARIRSGAEDGESGNAGIVLTEHAMAEARKWVRRLPIPPELARQAESAAEVPWVRFRTQVLKKIGRRPLGPVY